MYRCDECGNLFEEGEQKIYIEKDGFDYPPYREYEACPVCGGSFEEIKPCIVCGKHEQDLEEGVCERCRKEFKVRFDEALKNNFTEKEIKILLALYGEWMI